MKTNYHNTDFEDRLKNGYSEGKLTEVLELINTEIKHNPNNAELLIHLSFYHVDLNLL